MKNANYEKFLVFMVFMAIVVFVATIGIVAFGGEIGPQLQKVSVNVLAGSG